jgi:hypothetical protein
MSTQIKFRQFEDELLNPLKGHALTDIEMCVASILLDATVDTPVRIAELTVAVGRQLGEWPNGRAIKQLVRELRKEHGFPILSRKGKPAGYWWGASASEMQQFIKDWRKQALDELHTLSKMVKQNYPALAGQLSLEDAETRGEGDERNGKI